MYTNTIPCITKSFILYVLFFSCPILATDQTVPYYFTLLFFLSLSPSSPSLHPSPLFLFLFLYLLFQNFQPISKYILLYLVTRPDMPLQCIFWKPVETSNDNHSLSRLSLICVSGDDIFQLTALRDPDSSPPPARYKSTINELSLVMLQIQIWIILLLCAIFSKSRVCKDIKYDILTKKTKS